MTSEPGRLGSVTPPETPVPKQVVLGAGMLVPQGSYSAALRAGPWLFTAGTGGFDPETGELAGPSVEEQTAQALDNLEASLGAAGLGWAHVVKVTAHLAHLNRDFAGYDGVYSARVTEPWPVRTTVGSDLLLGMLVEIDLVAVVQASADAPR